jgi:2-methylcitrate dehydratase
VIEGKRGLQDSIAGHFSIRWQTEELERVTRTSLKRYVAEGHAQSAIEGILELKDEHHFAAEDVASISLRTFKQANTIVGTGREAGDKRRVETKEQADHSLPYLVAVALLDGDVGPAQFEPSRIARADVQKLLRKVEVEATWRCSRRYPESVPCELELRLKSGRRLGRKQRDWLGFFARPMPWSEVEAKFHRLAQRDVALPLRTEIVDLVANLERAKLNELARLLGKIRSADDPLAQDSLELARAGE